MIAILWACLEVLAFKNRSRKELPRLEQSQYFNDATYELLPVYTRAECTHTHTVVIKQQRVFCYSCDSFNKKYNIPVDRSG